MTQGEYNKFSVPCVRGKRTRMHGKNYKWNWCCEEIEGETIAWPVIRKMLELLAKMCTTDTKCWSKMVSAALMLKSSTH